MQTRLIRLSEVRKMTGLSKSGIYKYHLENHFPQSISLGGRSVAWVESEIEQWIENVVGQRDNNALSGYNMEDEL
jgi:prophage regulatory protein